MGAQKLHLLTLYSSEGKKWHDSCLNFSSLNNSFTELIANKLVIGYFVRGENSSLFQSCEDILLKENPSYCYRGEHFFSDYTDFSNLINCNWLTHVLTLLCHHLSISLKLVLTYNNSLRLVFLTSDGTNVGCVCVFCRRHYSILEIWSLPGNVKHDTFCSCWERLNEATTYSQSQGPEGNDRCSTVRSVAVLCSCNVL